MRIPQLALLLLLVPGAFAQAVYTVDETGGPGADFLEIQPAIDAASPGDRIEVMPGGYDAFTLDKGLTIMGRQGVIIDYAPFVSGSIFLSRFFSVTGVPAGQTAVVVDVATSGPVGMRVENCAGSVILDGLSVAWNIEALDNADLRIQHSTLPVRLEMVRTTANLVSCETRWVIARDESRVAISDGQLISLDGHNGCSFGIGSPPAGGGTALDVRDHSRVWVSRSILRGGHGGYDYCGVQDGLPGYALLATLNSTVTTCQCEFQVSPHGFYPSIDVPTASVDSTIEEIDNFPSMALGGGNEVGDISLFRCFSGAGTSVRLYAGRFARTNSFNVDSLPRFHSYERGVSLGAFPASEERVLPFAIPPLERGTLIHLQIGRTLNDGSTELSNGVTLIVR